MELPCKIIIFFISNKVVYKFMMMGGFSPSFLSWFDFDMSYSMFYYVLYLTCLDFTKILIYCIICFWVIM